jgi:hypothetical protein
MVGAAAAAPTTLLPDTVGLIHAASTMGARFASRRQRAALSS